MSMLCLIIVTELIGNAVSAFEPGDQGRRAPMLAAGQERGCAG